MKITVIKTWITEQEIEVPENLSPARSHRALKEWIADEVAGWADATPEVGGGTIQWQQTEVRDENDNVLLEASQ